PTGRMLFSHYGTETLTQTIVAEYIDHTKFLRLLFLSVAVNDCRPTSLVFRRLFDLNIYAHITKPCRTICHLACPHPIVDGWCPLQALENELHCNVSYP